MPEGVAAFLLPVEKQKAAMPASIAALFGDANFYQKFIVSDAENVVPTSYLL
jgi:hypothetical protein